MKIDQGLDFRRIQPVPGWPGRLPLARSKGEDLHALFENGRIGNPTAKRGPGQRSVPTDQDMIVVVLGSNRDQRGEPTPHRLGDPNMLVEGIAREDTAPRQSCKGQAMSRLRNPIRLVDVIARPDENVFENDVELAFTPRLRRSPRNTRLGLGLFEPAEGVRDLDFHAELIEVEMLPSQTNDFGIQLHPNDLRLGCHRASQTSDGSTAETQNQDPSPTIRWQPEDGRCNRIPDTVRRHFTRAIERREGFVDYEGA